MTSAWQGAWRTLLQTPSATHGARRSLQNSGLIRRRLQQLSSRLARNLSASAASLASSFIQEEELLMLHNLLPWRTADVTAGRATPYIFQSDHAVCSLLTILPVVSLSRFLSVQKVACCWLSSPCRPLCGALHALLVTRQAGP